MHWKILPIIASEMVIEMGRMTYLRNHGQAPWLPCPFFIIKRGEDVVMIDTGAPAILMCQLRAEPVKDLQTFNAALAQVDLKPGDITTVVLTHLMYDHCANAKMLPNARFWVQKAELEYAKDPHPLFAGAYHEPLFDGLNFKSIEGDYQLLPGIDLIHTPGHSPGCQSVAVKTDAGTAVITGFCCVIDNFKPQNSGAWVSERSPEVIPPGIHLDMPEAYKSVKRVKELSDIIVPNHDPMLYRGASLGGFLPQ